jgi:two-component system cell cycle response regulator
LLDVMMPGMTGYEVVSRLRANPMTHDIPVVMVTALDGAVRKRANEVGANGFLGKPLDRTTLIECVKGFLPP